MKYRKLRIAWSVGCGIFCLLLIVLWVRSFWRWDHLGYRSGAATKSVVSENGVLFVGETYGPQADGWKMGSQAGTEPAVLWRQLRVEFFDERPRFVCVAFPHWLPLLPLVILAVAPWLSWRFRTRTLLIITTAIAALLGLIAWASR